MYLSYINLFRAIATLFVVFNHSIHGLQWGVTYGNDEIARLLKIMFSNGAFFFVFIAGFIFQHLLYKYDYWKYVKSRFMLVILPYLVVSIPAVVAWVFLFKKSALGIPPGFYDDPWWYRVGYLYATGLHMAPLWFIPMIAMFYVLSPVFKFIDRYPWLYVTLPLLIIISYEYPRHWNPALQLIHFFPIYILGMAASRYKDQVVDWGWKLRYALFLGFVGFVCYEWFFMHTKQSFMNYMNKMCLSFLFLAILAHYADRPLKWLTWFASINFGVFFLHTYANAGLKILFAGGPARSLPIEGNVLLQFIYFGVVVALSIIGVLIVKKLTGKYSKYIVGA